MGLSKAHLRVRLTILGITMLKRLSALFIIFLTPFSAAAQGTGFSTPAPHAIIMDYETGIVLYEKDARKAIAPASMTKIMTAEIVFDRIRDGSLTLDTEFIVSEDAWRRGGALSGGSTMFLKPGSSVRVEDLLRGVIIQSGNDACIVLADGIAGSETAFAELMTNQARKMGLESAAFKNSTGWPHPEHKISLYDLAQLAATTIRDYPEFYSIYAERDFTWNNIMQGNRNPLLGRFVGADGLKTGHTEASGYGLVASAERGGQRRIMVVNGLGSKSDRRSESQRLMQAAFDNFEPLQLYSAGDTVGTIDVFMGKAESVAAVASEDVKLGIDKSVKNDIKITLRHRESLAAPITEGAHIADLVVEIPGRDALVIKLAAANEVKRKSAIGRVMAVLFRKFERE